MSRYQWEGWCLKLKTSTFKPCHIIWQLGSAQYNVDVVKAVFLNQLLGLAKVKLGRDLSLWPKVKHLSFEDKKDNQLIFEHIFVLIFKKKVKIDPEA